MTLKSRYLIWVLAWGGAAYGLLWLGRLPGDLGETLFGHGLCGVWG
jgi:hypothetical protein